VLHGRGTFAGMSIEVTDSTVGNVTTFVVPAGGVMVIPPQDVEVTIAGLPEGCRVEVTPKGRETSKRGTGVLGKIRRVLRGLGTFVR
jgi:hypothetical protein